MHQPQPTPGLEGSLEPARTGGDPLDSDDRLRPLAEVTQLARWESEGGALREFQQRTS